MPDELKQVFKGIPTAQQEALQQPSIDPVFTMANGLVFGPMAAARGLLQDLFLTKFGGWAKGPWLGQAVAPDPTRPISNWFYDKFLEHALSTNPPDMETAFKRAGQLNRAIRPDIPGEFQDLMKWWMRMGGNILKEDIE